MSMTGFSKWSGLAAMILLAAGLALPVSAAPAAAPAGGAYSAKFNIPWTPEKRDFRAVWIATVGNVDWPSAPGLTSAQQQAEFRRLLDDAVASGMNAVIVQIRPMGDAFYPTKKLPWSAYLTGQQGRAPNPYYDPLQFMIAEAHGRNLEFHAWFNPFRIGSSESPGKLVANHPLRRLSSSFIPYNGRLYLNPGDPAVRQSIIDSILEVVSGYDIDAVHLDDYFYPYPEEGKTFADAASYKAQNQGRFKSIKDWRRNNINLFVRDLSKAIKAAGKPWVKFGISPFGVWRNRAADPSGSDTAAKSSSYDDLCADTRNWIRNGWVDYILPQDYWYFGQPTVPYEKVLAFWGGEVRRNPRVHLYIGHALYKVDADPAKAWKNREEILNQLRYNQYFPEVRGSAFYNMSSLRRDPLGVRTQLGAVFYRPRALIPVMPWLGGTPPLAPHLDSARRESGAVRLSFGDSRAAGTTTYYVVYRFLGGAAGSLTDPRQILATVRKQPGTSQEFIDRTAWTGCAYTYVVTAVDRLHNESPASNAAAIPR
jgi:uncharacterized lipoprotein YddW (UPF0748 family)